MKTTTMHKLSVALCTAALLWSCVTPRTTVKTERNAVPTAYNIGSDTTNIAKLNWKEYFGDQNLIALIDTALRKNQELNITMQEIEISRNEVRSRKGEYLPFVNLKAGA